jgi:hypothetical protein
MSKYIMSLVKKGATQLSHILAFMQFAGLIGQTGPCISAG